MSDLDSFFAKKDKKKVKGRKYDNPDEIAKRLEESEKKLEKEFLRNEPPKKQVDESSTTPVPVSVSEPAPEKNMQQEEEEWKEYNEEVDKDMTDLKITKLQIEDDDDNGDGSGDDGEGGVGGSSKSEGVWNRNLDRVSIEEVEEVVPSAKEEQKSSLPASSYVPPHMRNVSSSSQSPQPKSNRKPKSAPDITNAMAFPSLSDAQSTNPTGPWGRKKLAEEKGFENVKHGSNKTFSDDYAPSKLSTSNRFDALSDNS